MFIKWHVYQRQANKRKIDRYIMQPILTESFRTSKKNVRRLSMAEFGVSEQEFEEKWARMGEKINRPRHRYLFKFPKFPSCAYVYYDKPQHIEQRKHYWMIVDALLESEMFSDISETDKRMIVEEIEKILPRPTPELLEVLENAYRAGMPRGGDPHVFFTSEGYGIKQEM